ncbi:MAG: hypothetical protein JW770_06755, partial [Actinobacteria bacterium]|nr:hypothetical protein [Actinomycetota bacterium]
TDCRVYSKKDHRKVQENIRQVKYINELNNVWIKLFLSYFMVLPGGKEGISDQKNQICKIY